MLSLTLGGQADGNAERRHASAALLTEDVKSKQVFVARQGNPVIIFKASRRKCTPQVWIHDRKIGAALVLFIPGKVF